MKIRSYWVVTSLLILTGQSALQAQVLRVDSSHTERPRHPKFIIETDQRFTTFRDSYSASSHPKLTSIWGARTGVLLPQNIKIEFGYYFAHQDLPHPLHFPDNYYKGERRLRFGTLAVERYWLRKKYWETSTLAEIGYGRSRYRLLNQRDQPLDTLRGGFIPIALGLSFSLKFPAIRGFRPLRWFGANFLTGYRTILRHDFPEAGVDYRGFFFAVGPIFFPDRFTDDVKTWLQRRKKR